ncbi:hypothetical protein NAEGRDRAFT_80246 [Naegleria gruberi]|uniref:Uncharacterized protein n=1 Tax=Naegleria gruberi TaxID=5762 RepID=D2VK03_NAEGR|nr:uncharacterized protein NAEGRDRAFT_80246 [Naegleria gruberi]EFC42862.1 hypothetical protein NAEGRDRAFT_80246 [Naegleria gruberi]|eukprot:XP_002675606.1 hypothetical protein NAEGRDRAFT_80246 [Naegleria gruberi strain NEG-M]
MSNLILVLKEILNTAENNSVRIAALEQTFVTQAELRKQLNQVKEDVKIQFGDSLKESHEALVDSVRRDIHTSVKTSVDREVSSITADIIDFKTRYADKMKEVDSAITDNLKTTIELSNKADRKTSSLQQLVDRLEYRTIRMEDSIREYSENFKKLQSRLSRINQSLNKNNGTNITLDAEIEIDDILEDDKKSKGESTPLVDKKKSKRKLSREENVYTTPDNFDLRKLSEPNTAKESGSPLERHYPLESQESSQSVNSLSDLSAPLRLNMGDLTLTKIQTKVNELKDYVDTLKDTLQHRIAAVKQDLREDFNLNIHATKKDLEDKINTKMEKKDVYHLLGFKSNVKELEKIKADYEFIMSMYAKLDKEVLQLKENPPTANFSFASSNGSPSRRQSIPLSNSQNMANSIVREEARPSAKKIKSTQDDPLNIVNRSTTSPPKERMPHIFGNSAYHKMQKGNVPNKKSATDVSNAGSRPLSNQTLSALSIIDKIANQRSVSAMEFREDEDGEVNLVGSDAKIYRFGNADKKTLRSASPAQLSDSEDEWNIRASIVGRSLPTKKASPAYSLSRLRQDKEISDMA